MSEEKFSRSIGPLHEGGLHGWKAHGSSEERHRAIERSIRDDGYPKTIERLDFIANVANRRNNRVEHAAARADIRWAEERHRASREEDDPRRSHRGEHEVSSYDREDGEHVRRHMARDPRRRRSRP